WERVEGDVDLPAVARVQQGEGALSDDRREVFPARERWWHGQRHLLVGRADHRDARHVEVDRQDAPGRDVIVGRAARGRAVLLWNSVPVARLLTGPHAILQRRRDDV